MCNSLSGFSWRERGRLAFGPKPSNRPASRTWAGRTLLPRDLRAIHAIHQALRPASRVTASVVTLHIKLRNINLISIDYASRPRLRNRLTLGRLALPRKPWTYGARVFHPRFRILMPAFSFPIPPENLAILLPRPTERSPTTLLLESMTSVTCLVPIILGAGSLDQ